MKKFSTPASSSWNCKAPESTQLRSLSLPKGRSVSGVTGSIAAFLVAIFLTACGESTTEKIVEVATGGTEIVSSVKDLPKCTKDNQGERVWVKDESADRVCVDGKWFATVAKDTSSVAFSCTTKELKDKNGLKIICNGDSIGVVLNGAKGEQGNQGENGTDGKDGIGCSIVAQTDSSATIKCGDKSMTLNLRTGGAIVDTTSSDTLELDSEKVAISMDSLAGYSQKGPFLKGSTVYLYELSDGRTLKQTNGNFTSEINSDDGRYQFKSRDLVSQYALLVADGKYRNEVTGKTTNTSIKLQAYTNMLMRKSANVNLLTHLEKERVYYLVTKEKMTVRAAKRQAQAEILAEFHIDASQIKAESEDLDVFGKTDADAALLAISILLQRDSSETELSVLLTEMANDLAEDGSWNNAAKRAEIADWVATVDSTVMDTASKLAKIRKNVKGWGLGGGNVPDFEKFVRKFWSEELGLGVCGSDSIPMGLVKHVPNKNSKKYYATSYTDAANKTRFICDDAKLYRWRAATDIEKDTMGWGHKFDEGAVRNGRINSNLTYVYQNKNWRLGTAMDSLIVDAGGKACLTIGETSVKYNNDYYICTANTDGAVRGWQIASDLYNDTYESRKECSKTGKYGDGTILVGRVNMDKKYVCDNGEFRLANTTELGWNRGCVYDIYGASVMFEGQYSYYKCSANGWEYDFENLNQGTLTYKGQIYKTIGIKTQMWMAENLNYEVDGQSYCYKNSADSCAKYGRLYTWAAAVGKTEEECGNGKSCYFTDKVRGICPEGWHLPNNSEWDTLYYAMGRSPYAMQAKDIAGWPYATDAYGFSALPAGLYNGNFINYVGVGAYFWGASENENYYAGNWILEASGAYFDIIYRGDGFSVRCIKDDPTAP